MLSPHLPASTPAGGGLSRRVRVAITLGCVTLLTALALTVFWYQDTRYSLPTPRPPALAALSVGQTVSLPMDPALTATQGQPVFLHFFNPDCPCSRFNAEHVRSLVSRFDRQVRFVAVVQVLQEQDPTRRSASLAAAARLFGSDVEAVVDDGGRIATACGVYSTPQAVILGPDAHTLLFRGNYNSSRYCADPHTEFARLALEAVVQRRPLPPESRAAMVAYGCQLPANVAPAAGRAPGNTGL